LFHYFGSLENGEQLVKELSKLDWEDWLHGAGTDLCVDVQYDDSLSKQVS
jgi:leukotriene-A4 hydrolase